MKKVEANSGWLWFWISYICWMELSMWVHWVLSVAIVLLSGTARAQTPEQLTDAMVFVAKGEEDGMPVERSAPVKKTFKNGRYVYEARGLEGMLATYANNPRSCVFEMGTIFGGEDIEPEVFDLNKATKLRLERYFNESLGHYGQVVVEGGDVHCFNGKCTYYHSMVVKNVRDKPRPRQLEVLQRYENAITFLKKGCPGKPY